MTHPLPAGWRLHLAAGVQVLRDGAVLLGGSPLRALTLSPRGIALVTAWLAGKPVSTDREERALARRLLDAGLAHPDPPPREPEAMREVTVVVPVYADSNRLRRCLAPLADGPPVIVVDDGSPDPHAIAIVAGEVGAECLRHPWNRGPAAARNTGLRAASTPLVAFLDADCVPPPGFPGRLLDHLADPAVGLVAPRIVSSELGRGPIAAYERVRSALDMGPQPARVRPYSTVWYVPSAAMVARRDALGRGFDEGLVLAEDVDLVWRLHDAGWQVRYDPAILVAHEDRVQLPAWYRRRVAYNESVSPLLVRHPERAPVLFLSPRAALAWAAALAAGWPAGLVALAVARAVRVRRALAPHVPHAAARAARIGAEITVREGRDLARAVAGPWAPFALAAARLLRGRHRRRLIARLGALLGAMTLRDWLTDRPGLDPVRYGALRLADESTRGLGIWIGCLRARDFRALRPRRPPPASQR
jgi:mycofactocin system glycosyltransferase